MGSQTYPPFHRFPISSLLGKRRKILLKAMLAKPVISPPPLIPCKTSCWLYIAYYRPSGEKGIASTCLCSWIRDGSHLNDPHEPFSFPRCPQTLYQGTNSMGGRKTRLYFPVSPQTDGTRDLLWVSPLYSILVSPNYVRPCIFPIPFFFLKLFLLLVHLLL